MGFDNGGEFKGPFKESVDNMGLDKKNTTECNPQGNSIIERIHQALGD